MKTYSKPIVPPADSQHNHVGLLAWSLLAPPQINMVGGIPGQPGPDSLKNNLQSPVSLLCRISRHLRLLLD